MPILAQQYPVFQPAMRILGLVNPDGELTRVVTTFPHQYKIGMIVRLNLPTGYTPQGLNQQIGRITEIIDPISFYVAIDSSQMEQWSSPTEFPLDKQEAQITPVGEVNEKLSNATRNVLPY